MYSQGSSIPAKLSVSLSLNALSHAKLQSAEYFVVHDSEKVSCISMQGSSVISSKEINFEAANEDNRHFIQIVIRQFQMNDALILLLFTCCRQNSFCFTQRSFWLWHQVKQSK